MDAAVFMHAFVPIACFLRQNYAAGERVSHQKALQSALEAMQKKRNAKLFRKFGFAWRFRRRFARCAIAEGNRRSEIKPLTVCTYDYFARFRLLQRLYHNTYAGQTGLKE